MDLETKSFKQRSVIVFFQSLLITMTDKIFSNNYNYNYFFLKVTRMVTRLRRGLLYHLGQLNCHKKQF